MVFVIEIEKKLLSKMEKIKKKDPVLYQRIKKKMEEISQNPDHYKPLSHDLKGRRRCHIDPFVLTFTVYEERAVIKFLDFAHHDKIYLLRLFLYSIFAFTR